MFVTFEKVETVNYILEHYECSFINTILKNALSFIKKSKLSFNGQ